jgi:two-component system cell cycle sensor histidine kinase/response regulator CckA
MEAIGTLAAGVAHDFNNALMAIMGYAEAAHLSLGASHRATTDLDGIIAAVEQAASVTKGLLTFSRDTPLDFAPVNLGRLVHGSSRMLQRMLPAAVEMTVEVAESDELWIRADTVQLNQILMNLVVNARDAMPQGGQLRISVHPEPTDRADAWSAIVTRGRGRVELVVEDTGCGMSDEVLARVCDPFFTTKSRGHGTGLGMSIVRGIIESHHGEMRLESKEGRGTRVTIRLPGSEPQTRAGTDTLSAEDVNGDGATILVAEDNEQVRAVIATALESYGYTVLEACNGEEASRLFEEQSDGIGLVVLDIDMPKKGGRACMREFHDRRPSLPIILITGFPDRPFPVGESCGERLLRKPFSPRELTQLVAEMLAGAPAGQE